MNILPPKLVSGSVLPQDFYMQETLIVAQALLGYYLAVAPTNEDMSAAIKNNRIEFDTSKILCGRIVETEAYLGHNDSAAHSYKKRPGGRSNAMFEMGGRAYVYFIYGLHYCLNAVTRDESQPEGVLIRALEPLFTDDIKALSGPGKLCKTLKISQLDYGTDLLGGGRITIFKPDEFIKPKIAATKRIGVQNSGEGADYLYRFFDDNSKSISATRKVK